MTDLVKAQLIHKQIMLIISSEMVQRAGELTEGWSREDHNHICHTVDVIETKRKTLQRQIESTALEEESQENLQKFRAMLKKDLLLLVRNTNSDGVPEEMHDIVLAYANQIKDTIEVVSAAINQED